MRSNSDGVGLRSSLPAHQLATTLIELGYSAHDLVMASGWMPGTSRESILENCEDVLEDWNYHHDCALVAAIRKIK